MKDYDNMPSYEKIKKSKGKNLDDKYGKFGCKKLNKRNKKNATKNYAE